MMKWLLMTLIKGYRLLLSPWLGASCRFEPTCSQYGLQALEKHGAAKGSLLITNRLLRCHPWCQGGCDPVPDTLNLDPGGLFTRLLTPSSSQRIKSAATSTAETDSSHIKVPHE
ncbi:membrane protein insertion efficiency factor YidD [Saezia sanguinis]